MPRHGVQTLNPRPYGSGIPSTLNPQLKKALLSDDELIDGAETHLVRAVIGALLISTGFGGNYAEFRTGLPYFVGIFISGAQECLSHSTSL